MNDGCILCGKPKMRYGKKYCIDCSMKQRRLNHNSIYSQKPKEHINCVICGQKLERYKHKYCHNCGIKVQEERMRNYGIEHEIKRKKMAEQWNKLTDEQQQNIMMDYCKEVLENE